MTDRVETGDFTVRGGAWRAKTSRQDVGVLQAAVRGVVGHVLLTGFMATTTLKARQEITVRAVSGDLGKD